MKNLSTLVLVLCVMIIVTAVSGCVSQPIPRGVDTPPETVDQE